jgi:hypothetical protein
MAIKQNNSKGKQTQEQVKLILEVILDFADGQRNDTRKSKPMRCQWNAEKKAFQVNDARVRTIAQEISQEKNTTQITDEAVNRAFGDLEELKIFIDRRGTKTQGVSLWQFDLKFQTKEKQSILAEFDRLWMEKWNSDKTAPHTKPKFPVKPSPLMHGIPLLPDNYVVRSDELSAVKEMLLGTTNRSKVSAIVGMGGLGKSLLAAKLVQDEEVQRRFEDGILWITLGEEPDLLREVGECIRALGQSWERWSATTFESPSQYLQRLLIDKRVLLVVDDVWNAEHLEALPMGCPGCRILVTTREANVQGAECYPLNLMTEEEAIALVRGKLKTQWRDEQAAAMKQFARVVGYLPLALDLSVNLVQDGMLWGELLGELEDERRVVELELLDATEAFEHLSEERQRKYSLKACFNLSLRRLSAEQRQRFAWLGVLRKNMDLSAPIAEILWDMRPVQAKKGLIELRSRSLLTDGVQTVEGVATYRVHDLMHDTARGLIEKGELGIESLEIAHGRFLERYRGRSEDESWYGLKNDGYIHRHLTWHLEMAGRFDEVHELMASGEDQNDWFEACDKIGQPGIFVEDVRRGWRLAEELYERDRGRAIVLQCRYALITGTLNSLKTNFSPELFSGIAQYKIWDQKKIISFIENINSPHDKAKYICAVIPYMPDSEVIQLGQMIESLQQSDEKAECLVHLSMRDKNRLQEAYFAVEEVNDNLQQAMLLIKLIAISENDIVPFKIILKKIDNISDKYHKAIALIEVIHYKHDDELLNKILLLANSLTKDDFSTLTEPEKQIRIGQKAFIHSKLIQHRPDLLRSVMDVVSSTYLKADKAHLLINLTKYYSTDFLDKALEMIGQVNGTSSQAELMAFLRDFGKNIVNSALTLQNQINDTYNQLFFILLFSSSEVDALKIAASITDSYQKARSFLYIKDKYPHVLVEMTNFKDGIEEEHVKSNLVLEIASKIQIQSEKDKLFEESFILANNSKWEHRKSLILQDLIQQEISDDLLERIKLLVGTIRDPLEKSKVLAILAKYDSNLIAEIDDLINLNINEYRFKGYCDIGYTSPHDESSFTYSKFLIFISLINHFPEYFFKASEMLEKIKNVSYHAMGLCSLVMYKLDLYEYALEEAQKIGADFAKADVLGRMISISPQHMISETMIAIDSIVDPFYRAEAYSQIIKEDDLGDCSYADWCELIHLFAHRTRAHLMGDLATLYPAILHLGGEDAGRGMVGEMGRICKQWK